MAITPAAGYVSPSAAMLIGLGVGVVCYGASLLRLRSRVDDALDVFAVHGVGGTFGAVATGVFASVAVNAAGATGCWQACRARSRSSWWGSPWWRSIRPR